MNKRLALVTLIKHSLLLSSDVKIALLRRVGDLKENDVQMLGNYLAAELQFVKDNAQKIQEYADTLVKYFSLNPMTPKKDNPDMVYVGTGKSTV